MKKLNCDYLKFKFSNSKLFFHNKLIDSNQINLIKNNSENIRNYVQYSYSPELFIKNNDYKYLLNLLNKENKEKEYQKSFDWINYLQNLEFSLLILFISCFSLYLWSTVPFSVIFKHFTISEYTFQKYYLHTIFLASLSNAKTIDFLIYFPISFFSAILLSKQLKTKYNIIFYIFNSILSSFILVTFEKFLHKNPNNIIMPITNGNSTFSGLIGLTFFATTNNYFKIILIFPSLYEIYLIIYKNVRNGQNYASFFSFINGLLFYKFLKFRGKIMVL